MMSMYTTLLVFGLATLSAAHMKMSSPAPYGESSLDNSPLNGDGSDFPCKQRSGVYAAASTTNTFALGSTQTVSFIGSAVHGGGSCQFSVTYDENPTASSTFKVIHSVEGGCPQKNIVGNDPSDDAAAVDPDTYSFTVPTSLPTGTATFAWTWFNKVGNREMYMNCAPITITAAASKRSEDEDLMTRNVTQLMERDQAAFNALPDMFVANIGTGCVSTGSCAQCQIAESVDVIFPTPGTALDRFGLSTSSALASPTGASCGGNYIAGVAAPAATGSASVAAPSTTPAVTPASSAPAATNTAVSGGVFATVPTSAGTQATSTPAVVAQSSAAASTPAASPVAASSPEASPAAASTPVASASTPESTGTTGSGSAIAAGTACTTEGMWNCIGGTSFQQCASGTWSVAQPLAAGTSCTAGQSMAIDITKHKRAVRFSGEHKRRHLQNS
ncbi:hypothetical protein L207DRAFT_264998 [Hyaloscypha variabilis F]|uniref:Lytic polysaccharide monooxygenase n=1 Tax=Hyaloscypha variabilis (strain UAMH 11265 / GT02V1 / F) TaxID=1149755 RepID=A0A2J6QRL3_HYAVF|nr:hypothetical protein L207DRAFT_264998 [Hyaloscypha variabilis F]